MATKKHSWYQADMRRRAIAKEKYQKHREHEADMAKVAERLDREREHTSVRP